MMNNNSVERKSTKRNGIILGVIGGALVLGGILGSYAFFQAVGAGNTNEEASVQTGNLALTFADGTTSFQGKLEFGGSATKDFTIENNGSLDVTAKVMWNDLVNTYTDGSLTYSLSFSETEGGPYTEEVVSNQKVPVSTGSTKELLAGNLVIPVGKKYYYQLTITLNYLESTDQTADLKAMLSTNFVLEESDGKDLLLSGPVGQTIKKLGKTVKSSESLNFAEPATTDETADGLYSLQDDYGISYFYRGDVTDNYVKFGKWAADTPDKYYGQYSDTNTDVKEYSTLSECQNASDYNKNCTLVSRARKDMYWRIIRVNGDGSVRMVYDGTSAHIKGDISADRVAWSNQKFNVLSNDAKYVGYMFGPEGTGASITKEQAQTNTASSDIKIKLEEWYTENLASVDSNIADSLFCYDRTTPGSTATGWDNDTGEGYGKSATAYGAYSRLGVEPVNYESVHPQFTCENKNDAFTNSDKEKGNGVLAQKIGLITADEVVAAGSGKYNTTNESYYLHKGTGYWAGSPYVYVNNSNAQVLGVNYRGYLNYGNAAALSGAAPVINLTAECFSTLIGDGTVGNEFRSKA